jgi:aminoglycoside phosphotransferase (APT) family kinase protein
MHADEIEIDETLVRRLLGEQFPDWLKRPLQRVEPEGTDNAIFRLGDDLAVRLARRRGPTQPAGKLFGCPRSLRSSRSRSRSRSDRATPRGLSLVLGIHTWVEGETAPIEEIDAIQPARDLAALVGTLQQLSPTGAPAGRGIPLAQRDREFRFWLERFDGDPRVEVEWEQALAAPPWHGAPVWHHGGLDVRNWLVRDGRIRAVIDWASMGVGDPACDVMVAWKLHSRTARDAFREALPTDDATWERARGWVLSQAVAILAYYTLENNPILYLEAERWLDVVLLERT